MDDKKFLEGLILMYQSNLLIQDKEQALDGSFFTKSEILKIISAIKENYIHLIWFKLLYSFGMNLQELVNLKVKDVDFEKGKLEINTGKKSLPRLSDIPPSLLCELRLHCNHKSPDSYLFKGRYGKLHTRTIQKALEKVELKINTKLTIAKLRKSIAVHLCQNGWDYKEIGAFLGHANYRATRNLLGSSRDFYRKSSLPIDEILS